jgi:hypothetical protein
MNAMKRKLLLLLLTACLYTPILWAQSNWPKEIDASNGGVITMYQPQPESLTGNKLSGRAAISYRKTANAEPIFGVAWFDAMLETNKNNRTAILESVKIVKSKFAESASDESVEQITKLIEQDVPNWEMELSLDDIAATIKQEQHTKDASLKNDPPVILYKTKPTTLVLIDGEPKVKMDDQLKMERVMNSPFLLFKYPEDKKYYLYAGGFWYRSNSIKSGYTYVSSLPSPLKDLDKQIKDAEAKDENFNNEDRPTKPTDIVVATKPTELIQTEGAATYKAVSGTTLLYADNTLDEIFKDVNSNKTYTLISGRWYAAPNLNGPWVYTPADQLPGDFSKIPQGSEKDGVLASVAGTEAAEEAIMDAQIPQTVRVDRKSAKCEVVYDGTPKFASIENTNLLIAENSNITVMKAANNKYYAIDNGIWFISNNATGPWEVANERPQDVEKIPASSPAYNTKYVYVYDQTPDYVYMGYTPGYLGSYVYGPTVVYGTGWYYRPWYGAFYYPRPFTFGFGFNYNPWTGWNMSWGMSFNFGWFHLGFGTGWGWGGSCWGGGWFGPPMYHPPYRPWGWNGGYYGGGYGRPGYGGAYNRPVPLTRPNVNVNRPININVDNSHNNINIGSNNNNIYNKRPGANTRDINRNPGNQAWDRPSTGNNNRPTTRPAVEGGTNQPTTRPSTDGNANRPTTRPAVDGGTERPTTRPTVDGGTERPSTRPAERPVARPSTKDQNNVLSDRNGNVYQRDDKGNWSQRDNNQWKPSTRPSTNDVNRDQIGRDRSDIRNNNYRDAYQKRPATPSYSPANRPSYSPSRPSSPTPKPASSSRPATRGRM